jgi:hypothetical protein
MGDVYRTPRAVADALYILGGAVSLLLGAARTRFP